MKNYSKMLQNYRFDNKLTQEQLANQLNVSRQLVSKWETGSSIPNADDLVQLAHLFQCTVDELLLEETAEKKESKIEKFFSLCKKHKALTCTIGIASIVIILLSIILPIVLTKYADYDYITYIEGETTYIQINRIDADDKKTIKIPKKIHGKKVGKISENAIVGANKLIEIELPFVGTELEPSEEKNGSFKKIFLNSELPSTLAKIIVTSNQVPNKAFSGVKVAEFDIKNAEIIGEEAFAYTSFSTIHFSNNLKEMKDYAFKGSSIKSLELYETIQYGIGVFSSCDELESIEIPDSWTALPDEFFSGCTKLKDVSLPSKLEIIGEECFFSCHSLSSLDIPETVKEIGEGAFEFCGLKSIAIPNLVTTLNNYTFSQCSALNTVILPNGLITIGEDCFSYCRSLSKIEFPDSLTSIGKSAFSSSSIQEADFSNTRINKISNSAFYGCENLNTIFLPTTLKTIENEAFYRCKNLTSISLPESVSYVGDRAFAYSSLESFSLNNPDATYKEDMFTNCVSLKYLKLPYIHGRLNDIIPFDAKIEEIEILKQEVIEERAFAYHESLMIVKLPNNLISLGSYAFNDCLSLTTILLPNTLKEIDDNAFNGCRNLKNINIPKELIHIGYNAFDGCESLTYTEYNNGLYLSIEDNPYEILIKLIDVGESSFKMHPNTKHLVSDCLYSYYISTLYLSKYISAEELSSSIGSFTHFSTIYFYGSSEEWAQKNYSNKYYDNVVFVDPSDQT